MDGTNTSSAAKDQRVWIRCGGGAPLPLYTVESRDSRRTSWPDRSARGEDAEWGLAASIHSSTYSRICRLGHGRPGLVLDVIADSNQRRAMERAGMWRGGFGGDLVYDQRVGP